MFSWLSQPTFSALQKFLVMCMIWPCDVTRITDCTPRKIIGRWFQIFLYVRPYLGKIPILTDIFQMGLKPPSRLTWRPKKTPLGKGKASSKPPLLCSMLIFQGVRGQFTIIFGYPAVSSLGDVPLPSRFDEPKSWMLDGNSHQRFYTCMMEVHIFVDIKCPPFEMIDDWNHFVTYPLFWILLNVKYEFLSW